MVPVMNALSSILVAALATKTITTTAIGGRCGMGLSA